MDTPIILPPLLLGPSRKHILFIGKMPKEQSRRLLARNVWGKYFCLFGLRNGQELTCYSENCNRQISLAASHSLSVTSVTLLLFLCSFPSLSILLMLFAFQHCQQLWAISLAFNIVNKFQHWQHLFTFNIHNVNLLYFSQCPVFNFMICFSFFSLWLFSSWILFPNPNLNFTLDLP